MDTLTTPAAALPAASGLDLAALAADNLTPVLGRYFERSWSHGDGHRLYDTDGRGYLDFGNGIAVSVLGHRNPRITAAIHAQVDRLIAPMAAMGYADPTVRLARELAATLPEPLDSIFFMNSGSEAIEAALKLARRVTGRPGIIAFRGGFHGRTLGAASITSSNINYRRGYEPLLPRRLPLAVPSVYRDFGGDEDRAVEVASATSAISSTRRSAGGGGRDRHRARAGRRRYIPLRRPSSRSCGGSATGMASCCRRRGPGGLRADGQDVVVRARRDRARHRLLGQAIANGLPLPRWPARGPSRSAGERAPTARPTAGTR